MKKFKLNFLILLISLLSINTLYAQSITTRKADSKKTNYYNITNVKAPIDQSKLGSPVSYSKEIQDIDLLLVQIDNTFNGANVNGLNLPFNCIGSGCALSPMGGVSHICVKSGSSQTAANAMEAAFKSNMTKLENNLKAMLGERNASLKLADCQNPDVNVDTVIKAIECQRIRLETAFSEMSDKEEKMYNKDTSIKDLMEENKLMAEFKSEMGADKKGINCEGAAVQTSANKVTERAKENYRDISNTTVQFSNLNKETLSQLSSIEGEEYRIDEVARSRIDASLASQMPGDFTTEENQQNQPEIELVSFDEKGYIKGIPTTTEGLVVPEGYKFPEVYPGADRDYAKMVLDVPVIKDNIHMSLAVNSAINLINPLPTRNEVDTKILTSEKGKQHHLNSLSKKARYSLANDITNYSTSFRSLKLSDKNGNATPDAQVSEGAEYIKTSLDKVGANSKKIGNDISEYQFLEAIAKLRPQAPGYPVILDANKPTTIDKEVIRSLGTTLAIKWKQYQLLEKLLAIRATNMSVNLEK